MRFIYITLLILNLIQCRHYFVRDAAKYNLTQEEENILKSKKIGVLGFHPFYTINVKGYECCPTSSEFLLNQNMIRTLQLVYEKKDSEAIPFNPNFFVTGYGKRRKEQALSSQNTAKQFLGIDITKDKSKIAKPNKSISDANLRFFLKVYLDQARHLGHSEVLEILDFSEKNKIYLKENNFDYWIIGFHAPEITGYSLNAILTFPLSIYSAGILPYWSDELVKSSFWIFDKKLNLLKKIEFKNEYNFIAASWIVWKDEDSFIVKGIPIEVFEPDLKEFSKDLVNILKEQNHN